MRGRSGGDALLRGARFTRCGVLTRLHPIMVGLRQCHPRALCPTHPEGRGSDPQGGNASSRGGVVKAAIYARVSTFDQEPENQLRENRRYAEARGWTAVEYVDRGI